MPDLTLAAFELRQHWPDAWGLSGTLVVCLDREIVSDGQVVYPATKNLGAARLRDLGFHWRGTITVINNRAYVGLVSGLPTTDTSVPNNARYHVYIYDSAGRLIDLISRKPYHLLSTLPPVVTWAAWDISNEFHPAPPDPNRVADLSVVLAMINAALASYAAAANGQVTLVNGAATVLTPSVTDTSNIQLTSQDENVTGELLAPISLRVSGESFEIRSTNIGDNGVVGWGIMREL